jgi:hypothetical protein
MDSYSPFTNPQPRDASAGELYLRVGTEIFGVSFLNLPDAQIVARQISASGRDVDIFEKNSGFVLQSYRVKGANPYSV